MSSKLHYAIFLLFIALIHASASSAQCNPTTSIFATYNYTGTAAQVTWPAVTGATGYEVFVATSPATLPPTSGTTVISNNFNATSLTAYTKYDICIRTICSSGSSSWFCDTLHTNPAPCPLPTGVVASAAGPHSATISWMAISGVPAYEYGYSDWSPQPGANLITTTSTSATISNLRSYHTYYVSVRSKCNTFNKSNWVTDTAALPIGVNISEVENDALSIYPNPTTDKFYIEAGNHAINEISLTDMYGKVLLSTSLQTSERKEIDLSSYARGLYILSYETPYGTKSQKIQKL